LNDNSVDIDFLELLKTDEKFKVIFLLFYTSQMYHIAHLLKAKNIPIPGVISFSGTASKLLTIIDTSKNHDNLKHLTIEAFKYVFKVDEGIDIDIRLPSNPKEISSKGGLSMAGNQDIDLDHIKETLISNSNLQVGAKNKISYKKVKDFEDSAMESFDDFLKFSLV